MYPRLGVVELSPIDMGDDGAMYASDDPGALTPTVIQTIDYGPSGAEPVLIAPLTVDPTQVAQVLPTLVSAAVPAKAGLGGGLGLLVLLGLGVWAVQRGGGGSRSW